MHMNTYVPSQKKTSQSAHSLSLTHTQGGIEALVTAMGRHVESPDVQEKAAAALCNLADRSDLRQRIQRAGAGEAMRRAMAVLPPRQKPRPGGRRCWTR
jgi:hypothetical protein